MESLQIPKRLMQSLRKRAEELGVTPEEFLFELMVDAVDPGSGRRPTSMRHEKCWSKQKRSSDRVT